ncbi:MAG: tRNA (adenosine(37)-N6)-threonylcarbamoyltransferase complex ATPase subunit type 1 TsaE [Gammaproteobacteria bacterium]|nr:tRNA (adenosine(37)-N6)-threonylcarbamoyltransferase complex ATPase subunit type 1 TsaE [Gammaproteobacteria bacterium]
MKTTTVKLPDADATLDWGTALSAQLGDELVFLRGELGVGKTTLARGILRGLGHTGPVKSPTYTLLEPYALGDREIFHFDFYRIVDPEELEFIGVDDLMGSSALKLIEWPERAGDRLPDPDVDISLHEIDGGRLLEMVDHRSLRP